MARSLRENANTKHERELPAQRERSDLAKSAVHSVFLDHPLHVPSSLFHRTKFDVGIHLTWASVDLIDLIDLTDVRMRIHERER